MKIKYKALALLILIGPLGVHMFYLDRWIRGGIYYVFYATAALQDQTWLVAVVGLWIFDLGWVLAKPEDWFVKAPPLPRGGSKKNQKEDPAPDVVEERQHAHNKENANDFAAKIGVSSNSIESEKKSEAELTPDKIYRILITSQGAPLVNMVYAEVGGDDYEVFGAFSGLGAGGGLFHQTDDGLIVSDDPGEFTSRFDFDTCNEVYTELEGLRSEFEEYDNNGEMTGLSDAGLAFLGSANENAAGIAEVFSNGASEDFIYDCQDQWNLDYYRETESEAATPSSSSSAYFVIAVNSGGSISSRVEEAADRYDDDIIAQRKAALDASIEIINEIAYRLDGFVDCLAASGADSNNVSLQPYDAAIECGALDDALEDFNLFIRFNQPHDSDSINQEFLSMDEWGFYAHWIDENNQVRTQGYDFGEFDTGYFAAIEWGNDETEYLDKSFQPAAALRTSASLTKNASDALSLGDSSIESAQKDAYQFYVKTEPSGEVACTRVSQAEAIKIIEDCLSEKAAIDELQDLGRQGSICHLYGIFGSGGETNFDDEPTRVYGEPIGIPKDTNGNYHPGIYIIVSALSKASLELEIPNLNSTNIKELELRYESFNFPVKHPVYGNLASDVLAGIEFKGRAFDHSDIIDRGYDLVTHVVFAELKKCHTLIAFQNHDVFENNLSGKSSVRTLIALANHSLATMNNHEFAADLCQRAINVIEQHQITNTMVLEDLEKLSTDIKLAESNISNKNDDSQHPKFFVIAINSGGSISSRIEEALDSHDDDIIAQRQAALDASTEIINEIAYRLDGFVDCLAASGADPANISLQPYHEAIKCGALDDSLEDFNLFIRFGRKHDSDAINEEFLSMDEWGFYAHWIDENDQVRTQGYDFGEFDTGYFAAIEWGNDETDYLDKSFQPALAIRKAENWTASAARSNNIPQTEALDTATETERSYELVLIAAGDKKVNLIKAVRAITDLGLADSKEIVDRSERGTAPVVAAGLTRANAQKAKALIEQAGGSCTIEPETLNARSDQFEQ